jgi:hypothetical protein
MARRKRRKSHRGFAEVAGKKWYKAKPGRHFRKIAANVVVARIGDTGERIVRPYKAIVCIGTRRSISPNEMRYPRVPGNRCGEARGKSPTRAIKAALADVARSFK